MYYGGFFMSEKSKINIRSVVKGIVFSVISTLLLVLLTALISYFTDISERAVSVILFAVSVVSVFTGAVLVCRSTGENGLFHGGLIGLGYFVFLLVSSVIIKREFDLNINLITMLFSNIAGGMLGGVLGINSK